MDMGWASGEVVGLLTFLVPGVVAAAVFYQLTSHPKPVAFDRIVFALVLTLVCQFLANGAASVLFPTEGEAGAAASRAAGEAVFSILIAIFLSFCLSLISNTDLLHRILRRLHVTRESAFPSEWYFTFARRGRNAYVTLHLRDGRRLYGHPEDWPIRPNEGCFCVTEAEWLDEHNKRTPLKGVSAVVVPAADVSIVEFLPSPTSET